MKLLVWLVLIVLVVLAIKKNIRSAQQKAKGDQNASAAHNPQANMGKPSEDMISCAYCQLYIPASEAITQDGQAYCSTEHSKLKK